MTMDRMDRKQFLDTSLRLGTCCGVVLLLGRAGLARGAEHSAPPCDKKMSFVKGWVADFMGQMDARLDQATRERLMEANGRACFRGGHDPAPRPDPPIDVDRWIAGARQHLGPENVWRDGDVVHFKYVANPRGLRVADGYCLCPIVEDGPATLSPTFCHCSVGYVSELFASGTGRQASVALADSLRRGGKECHFVIRLS
jgi:hypothetical protein